MAGIDGFLYRTLFTSASQLNNSINLLTNYKHGKIQEMNPELWQAKKIVDSTLHPDTGNPVLLPFRMSCYVFSNLVVTAGMLIPGMKASKSVLIISCRLIVLESNLSFSGKGSWAGKSPTNLSTSQLTAPTPINPHHFQPRQ